MSSITDGASPIVTEVFTMELFIGISAPFAALIGIGAAIVALLVLDICAIAFGADSRDAWCTDGGCTPSGG